MHSKVMVQVDSFEAAVVGSGFGGTILALSLANKFEQDNKDNNTKKKVCILERGQWWISHELNYTPKETRKTHPNMREYLTDNNFAYHFWPHPDNVKGIIDLASAVREISKQGLFDYNILGNVHVITASGVGGGSLVYSNVTLEPHSTVYKDWPTQYDGKKIEEYFEQARTFIGVNKITTTAGLSTNKLEKTKTFQEAGQALLNEGDDTIVNIKKDSTGKPITDQNGKPISDFDIDLSITDVPAGLSIEVPPSQEKIQEINTLLSQNNVCERQGRCNLGCIPGARHTLNKKLVDALNPKPTNDNPKPNPKPLEIRDLCEVYDIEYRENQEYQYTISFYQYAPKSDEREQKQILAKTLIISAGSLGSTELLLKCKERDHLQLSEILGKKFFTNGDLFAYMKLDNKTVDITRGPINTSHIGFKTDDTEFAYTIEDTTIPKMVAPAFATLLELNADLNPKIGGSSFWGELSHNVDLLRRFGLAGLVFETISLRELDRLFTKVWRDDAVRKFLNQNLKGFPKSDDNTFKFLEKLLIYVTTDYNDQYASPQERLSKFFVFSCMGRGEKPGVLTLVQNWQNMEISNDPGEKLSVLWFATENNRVYEDMLVGIKKLAGKIEKDGDNRVFLPLWNTKKPESSTTMVLHPLGGCNMGKDSTDGVVDSYGSVFWNDGSSNKKKTYPGLYVIDGSIIPESAGVNPSLTIAAVSFRAAEKIVGAQFFP
jgi:choline dehydrogenase-like flavoprotein